ncbi:MAG: mevalonate kinase family protein [Chitinophagales bacterium]
MQNFSSKILLFGEYSVVVGGNALAIPFETYGGNFQFWDKNIEATESAKWSNQALADFARAIKRMTKKGDLLLRVDTERFIKDLKQGLFFDSNIPKGYGLGSSGAVVAGIVSRYGVNVMQKTEMLEVLQREFAVLESHFHGQSSGFDPLVCYLNQAILKTKGGIQTIDVILKKEGGRVLFLMDTRLSRETGPLVEHFLNCLKEPYFDLFCKEELKPINNICIEAFLEGNGTKLAQGMKILSKLQWKYFQKMIPTHCQQRWKTSLESGIYTLKLCGAGGGGCMMGLTTTANWELVKDVFGEEYLKEICRL